MSGTDRIGGGGEVSLQHQDAGFFLLFRASPVAYGDSQARGDSELQLLWPTNHSHSNADSRPHLQPTSQLMATPDP